MWYCFRSRLLHCPWFQKRSQQKQRNRRSQRKRKRNQPKSQNPWGTLTSFNKNKEYTDNFPVVWRHIFGRLTALLLNNVKTSQKHDNCSIRSLLWFIGVATARSTVYRGQCLGRLQILGTLPNVINHTSARHEESGDQSERSSRGRIDEPFSPG